MTYGYININDHAYCLQQRLLQANTTKPQMRRQRILALSEYLGEKWTRRNIANAEKELLKRGLI